MIGIGRFISAFIFILIAGVSLSTTAQPIYSIQRGGVEVGILAGGVHGPGFAFPESHYPAIHSQVERSTGLYIEFDGVSPSIPQIIKEFSPRPDEHMRTWLKQKKAPCLNKWANSANSFGLAGTYLLDIPPGAFFARWLVPVSTARKKHNITTASTFDYFMVAAIKKEVPIQEMEGWRGMFDFLLLLNQSVLFDAVEDACVQIFSPDYFKDGKHTLSIDDVVNYIDAGNSDMVKEITSRAFVDMGWSIAALDALFLKRNVRFAEFIDKTIGSKISSKPLFLFGAAHLGGKDGIMQLLKNMGYKIIAIR